MKFSISNTIRTNNFKDAAIQEKIMGLWQQSTAFVAQAKEQGKSIAAIYHDYESDYKGDYSLSICKENETEEDFDTSKYQWKEYKVDSSDELGVLNAWKKIWSEEEAQIIQRVYDFDFENYPPAGEISIFIAVQ